MKNRKMIRLIVLLILSFAMITAMLFSGGCSITDASGFTVDLHTKMIVTGEFSGERVMTVSFDKAMVLSNIGSLEYLEEIANNHMPDYLEGELVDDENGARYVLTLKFSSKDDYIEKIKTLLGRTPNITFETSDEVFMKGLTFQEDFESKDLFAFVDVNSIIDSYVSDADISYSDIQVAAFIKQTGVVISVDEKEYSSEGGRVDVAEGKATMISKISFKTVLKSNGYFERVIEFRMIPEIDQDRYAEIIAYFESVKPDGAEVTAGELSSSPVISVAFKARDVSELSSKTTQIIGDTCTAGFGDATDASVPFASVEEFTENISFAKLCLDSQMPFTYNIVSERGSPSQLNVVIDGVAVDSQPTLGGNTLDYGSQASYATITTRYQSISTASLVYYNLISHGDDKYTREVYIIMDEETSDDVLNNIKAFYDTKNAPNTEINVLHDGFSETFSSPCVEIRISGSSKDITRSEDILFGGSTERKISYSRAKSITNVSPDTTLSDVYDISSLLSMTNVTSYYYAFNSDDDLRRGSVASASGSQSVESEDKYLGFMMSDGAATVTFVGGYTNVDAIIFIILLVLFIILLLVLAAILVLRYLKSKADDESDEPVVADREPFPVVIEEEPEVAEVVEEPVIAMPPVRDLTQVIEQEEEPVEVIEIESYPPTNQEPVIEEIITEDEDSAIKVTVKPIIPIYAEQNSEDDTVIDEAVEEADAYQISEADDIERFDEDNRAPEVPFERSPFEEEYDREFAEMKKAEEAEVYSDEDMLNDLETLGLLDEYIDRAQKVKIKVKKYKKD